MKKKLTKHGKSITLVIDKSILKKLKMDAASVVNLSITDEGLLVSPTRKSSVSQKDTSEKIITIAKRIMKKHDAVFKKLAKT